MAMHEIELAPEIIVRELPAETLTSRDRWLELGLLLLVAIAPAIFDAFQLMRSPNLAAFHATTGAWFGGLVHEAGGILLLVWMLRRRRQTLRHLGLAFKWNAVLMGVGLAVLGWVAYAVAAALVGTAIQRATGSFPHEVDTSQLFGSALSVGYVAYVLLSPWFEELIVRGFLMRELIELRGSRVTAVLASTLIQASYHLYYGWWIASSMAFLFLVFAIYYARTRKLMPVILAHLAIDVAALIFQSMHR
jgi:membrane protease YdiL (CAAX protease family)